MVCIQFNERMIGSYATVELAKEVVRQLKTSWPIEYCSDENAQWVFEDAEKLFVFEEQLRNVCQELMAPYRWHLTLIEDNYQGSILLEHDLIYQ